MTGTTIGGTNPTSITNTTIRNNHSFQLQITNTTGTLTDLQMSGNTISSTGASGTIANLFNFLGAGGGTGSLILNLTSGTFTGAAPATATGLQCDHSGNSGTATCNISGATFTNNNVAVTVLQAQGGNLRFNVTGNTATGNRSHGLNLFVAAIGTRAGGERARQRQHGSGATRLFAGGTFNLRQTSLANLAAANSPPNGVAMTTTTLAQISAAGTITFNAGACTQP